MDKNKAFSEALSNFTSDVAYRKAIEHLHELGLSVPEIEKRLDYPVSQQKIAEVVERCEREKNSPEAQYEFVQDVDAFGRKSFRRVKKS